VAFRAAERARGGDSGRVRGSLLLMSALRVRMP